MPADDFKRLCNYFVLGSPDWFLHGAIAVGDWIPDNNGGCAVIAYSSKPIVYIFLLKCIENDGNDTYSIDLIEQIHTQDRLLCISLCKSNDSNLEDLFLCCADGLVKNWSYANHEWCLSSEINIHSLSDGLNPSALTVCYDTNCKSFILLIGCTKGTIIVTTTGSSENKPLCRKFENDTVTLCSWKSSQITDGSNQSVVGYKKGIVGVYCYQVSSVTSSANIIQLARFYAHEQDICHAAWIESISPTSFDLITSSRDRFVKTWDLKEGMCRHSVKVSAHSGQSKRSGLPWIAACQLPVINGTDNDNDDQFDFIVSGLYGELYKWMYHPTGGDDEGDDVGLVRINTLNDCHKKLVFRLLPVKDCPHRQLLVSIGQDRKVLVWQRFNTDAGQQLSIAASVPTIAAGILCLDQASSSSNSPIIAGLNDGSLLVWRCSPLALSNENNKRIQPLVESPIQIWPRGSSATAGISCIRWHPLAQYGHLLAYGTESGCVEVVDSTKTNRMTDSNYQPKHDLHSFGSTVYRVDWGPHPSLLWPDKYQHKNNKTEIKDEDVESKPKLKYPFYVYSVCRGKIFSHFTVKKSLFQDVSLNFAKPPGVSDDEWKSTIRSDLVFLMLDEHRHSRVNGQGDNGSIDLIADRFTCLVTVGYRSGCVDIYALLRRRDSPSSLNKSVDRLQWICRLTKHTKCVNYLTWSPNSYWLAIGSNEQFVTVHDLTDVLLSSLPSTTTTNTQSITSRLFLSTYLVSLTGHCNRITGLDWSPHDPSLLASSSFDGTVNVWHIKASTQEVATPSWSSMANFRGHRSRVFTCLWHRNLPDLVFSGSESSQLMAWSPSSVSHSQPPNSRRYRPPPVKKTDFQSFAATNNLESTVVESESTPSPSISTLPEVAKTVDHEPTDNKPAPTSHKRQTDRRKRPALLPLFLPTPSTDSSSQNRITADRPPFTLGYSFELPITLLLYATKQQQSVKLDRPSNANKELLLLLPQPDRQELRLEAVRFVLRQAASHLDSYRQSTSNHFYLESHCILLLWLGRVNEVAQLVASECHLPFWLLLAVQLTQSHSSPIGIDLIGDKVAELATHDAVVASTLLVTASRHLEAVECLLNHDKVKEALLLCWLRLQPDPLASHWLRQCLIRLVDRKLMNNLGTAVANPIYTLCKQWSSVEQMSACLTADSIDRFFDLLLASSSTSGPVDQLIAAYFKIKCLARLSPGEDRARSLSYSFYSLGRYCLEVGYSLLDDDPASFFSTLLQSIDDLVATDNVDSFRFLLELALTITSQLSPTQTPNDLPLPPPTDCIYSLPINLSTGASPPNNWPTSLVDLTLHLCHLFSATASDDNQEFSSVKLRDCLTRCLLFDVDKTLVLARAVKRWVIDRKLACGIDFIDQLIEQQQEQFSIS